ncbi:MAG: TraR/DksA C4-type zinc finger protein [Candidatus Limnocylindria bacterium]
MDTARFRAMLETTRADVARTLAAVTERLAVAQSESGGELSLADQHPADSATETEERELDLTRQRMFEARLRRIDAATDRIAKGTYGRCAVCGQPIPEERLEALPETPWCVKDAAREER